jgi:putative ABC transport system substrate-binding protein
MRRREFITLLGGAAAAWPIKVAAQQPAVPVIGVLGSSSGESSRFDLAAFDQGLRDNGYVEGRNVAMEHRWAEGRIDRLPAMAGELVRRPASLILANANAAALAAKAATSTIPVVFVMGGDPIKFGLVASLNRPGGNMTGAALLVNALIKKRLELLHQLVPTAVTIAFLVNPTNPDVETRVRDARAAAVALSLQLPVLRASNPSEIEAAFASLAGGPVGAVLIQNDPYLSDQQSDQIVALAARHRMPTGFEQRKSAEDGQHHGMAGFIPFERRHMEAAAFYRCHLENSYSASNAPARPFGPGGLGHIEPLRVEQSSLERVTHTYLSRTLAQSQGRFRPRWATLRRTSSRYTC